MIGGRKALELFRSLLCFFHHSAFAKVLHGVSVFYLHLVHDPEFLAALSGICRADASGWWERQVVVLAVGEDLLRFLQEA